MTTDTEQPRHNDGMTQSNDTATTYIAALINTEQRHKRTDIIAARWHRAQMLNTEQGRYGSGPTMAARLGR